MSSATRQGLKGRSGFCSVSDCPGIHLSLRDKVSVCHLMTFRASISVSRPRESAALSWLTGGRTGRTQESVQDHGTGALKMIIMRDCDMALSEAIKVTGQSLRGGEKGGRPTAQGSLDCTG